MLIDDDDDSVATDHTWSIADTDSLQCACEDYSVQFVKHCSTVGASMMPNATVTVAQTQIYLLDIVNASFYSESQWWSVHGHGCVRLQRGLLKR